MKENMKGRITNNENFDRVFGKMVNEVVQETFTHAKTQLASLNEETPFDVKEEIIRAAAFNEVRERHWNNPKIFKGLSNKKIEKLFMSEFIDKIIELTNTYRNEHNPPPPQNAETTLP